MLAIFRDFRRLVEAVEGLAAVLRGLLEVQKEAGPALDRIDALEMYRHQFEAQIEGTLLKAEGKLKAASNAEARERQLKRSYERQLDEVDLDSETRSEAETVRDDDAANSEAERVRALRLDVATTPKTHALKHKFGIV